MKNKLENDNEEKENKIIENKIYYEKNNTNNNINENNYINNINANNIKKENKRIISDNNLNTENNIRLNTTNNIDFQSENILFIKNIKDIQIEDNNLNINSNKVNPINSFRNKKSNLINIDTINDPFSASQQKSIDEFKKILSKVDENLQKNKEFISLNKEE